MTVKLSCSAIVEHNSGILLVSDGGLSGDELLTLPGGGPRKAETILDCVVRETEEESGLVIEPETLIGIYQMPRTESGNNVTRFVFAAKAIGGLLTRSDRHPVVGYYQDYQVRALELTGHIKGNSTLQAIHDYRQGQRYDLGILHAFKKHPKQKLVTSSLVRKSERVS